MKLKLIGMGVALMCLLLVVGCSDPVESVYTPSEVLNNKENLVGKEITVMGKYDLKEMLLIEYEDKCMNPRASISLEDELGFIDVVGYDGEELSKDQVYKIKGIWRQDKCGYYLEFKEFV